MDNNKVSSYKEWENIGRVSKEITENITMGSDKITKRQKAQDYRFWDGNKYRIRTKTSFARIFTPADHSAPNICDILDRNRTQLGSMTILINDMDKNNMVMYYDQHTKTAVPANKKLFYKIFSDNPNSAWRAVKPLLEKGVIREWTSKWKGGKTERYYVNPLYTLKDYGINLDIYKLFKEELDTILSDKSKEELALLLYYDCHPEELLAMKEKELKELEESFGPSIEDILEEMKANCEIQQDEAEEEAENDCEYTIEHGGVKDGFFKRNAFIPLNGGYDAAKDAFINQCNNKDVYYCAYAHEDKDNDQSKLYGKLYIDLDSHSALESEEGFQNIVGQARNVVAFFRDEMSVPVDMQEVFFSGSKGFHITISPEVFGILPTKNLNKEFKAIAQKLEAKCAPAVDTAIYDRRRLFRYPNSINGKTGLYKVPVSYEMLSNCTLEEMKAWASQKQEVIHAEPKPIQEAAEAYRKLTKESTIKVAKKVIKKAPAANSSLLPCIQSILDNGAEVGQRNDTTVALASGLLQANYSYEEVVETLTEWNNDRNAEPLSETELMNTIDSAHQMFLDDKKYGCTKYSDLGYCSDDCRLCQKSA